MGIFSLFGKKERPAAPPATATPASRRNRDDAARAGDPADDVQRGQQAHDQRQAARATALKIDAIESEMSSEFVRPSLRPAPVNATPAAATLSMHAEAGRAADRSTAPGEDSTGLLLDDTVFDAPPGASGLEDVPLFEEVAVLYADGQTQMVERILQEAIEDDRLGSAGITAWAMLFDLYQIDGDQVPFDNLSIAYASRFETSPPAWAPHVTPQSDAAPARAAAVPSVVFSGKLDAGVVKTLERARTLAATSTALRLEFSRISEVDPIGCGLLLRVLNQLQKSGIDLILVGAPELIERIRAILAVGRRDETEAPWLLLMELLALLNLETAFEEASIDYCVTFEVSPPAFVAPKNKVTTAMEEPALPALLTDVFRMPALVEGRTDALVAALREFAGRNDPARVDCAALARVDVSAAGQLLAGLTPLAGDGRSIEFINVNHLVAALFNVIGLKDIVRIVTNRII